MKAQKRDFIFMLVADKAIKGTGKLLFFDYVETNSFTKS